MKPFKPKTIVPTLPAILILTAALVAGCNNEANTAKIPYTDLSFSSTVDEIIAAEGENYETYESIYEGTTYTFDKTYMEKTGTVKYMCDAQNAVKSIAWTYVSDDGGEIMVLYNNVFAKLKEEYGEPTQKADGVGNYAEVWKREEGNIILSAVITNDARMMQVAFLSPDVSK